MRNFKHERILELIGISFDTNNAPLIVTPFLKNGNVRDYVRNANNVCSLVSIV
jgi:hypothetical protein